MDGKINPKFAVTGNWTVQTQLGTGVGGQEPVNYTSLVGDYDAVLTFRPPRYSTFLVLNGSMGPDYDMIIFFWNPTPVAYTTNTVIVSVLFFYRNIANNGSIPTPRIRGSTPTPYST